MLITHKIFILLLLKHENRILHGENPSLVDENYTYIRTDEILRPYRSCTKNAEYRRVENWCRPFRRMTLESWMKPWIGGFCFRTLNNQSASPLNIEMAKIVNSNPKLSEN